MVNFDFSGLMISPLSFDDKALSIVDFLIHLIDRGRI